MAAIPTIPGARIKRVKALRFVDLFLAILDYLFPREPKYTYLNQAVVQNNSGTTRQPIPLETPTQAVATPAPIDLHAGVRMGRSAKLNHWAEQLLIGATGVKHDGSYEVEGNRSEPLFVWTTPSGDIYCESFVSLPNRQYAIVLYRYYGNERSPELVAESL